MSGEGDAGTDTRQEIMDATYRAVIKHGFAELTMQQIATESDTSTALLHYHYDTKEELLVAFLDYLIESLDDRIAEISTLDPTARLYAMMDWFVLDEGEDDREAFHIALLELRTQTPHRKRYRERMYAADERLRSAFADAIRAGQAAETFRAADPEQLGTLLLATMDGARTRQLTLGTGTYAAGVREACYVHVLEPIFTDAARREWKDCLTGDVELTSR